MKEEINIDISKHPSIKYLLRHSQRYEDEAERNRRVFDAARTLDMQIPQQTIIIGCGGIGSWVAMVIGTSNTTKSLVLIDPDSLELSNLNRTPFRTFDVGDYKVSALAANISENNERCNIIPINNYFNEGTVDCIIAESKVNPSLMCGPTLVVDCRDDDFQDYELLDKMVENNVISSYDLIRVAYDEISVTLDFNPRGRVVWGQRGYTVQPSHVLPAYVAAMLACVAAFSYNKIKNNFPNLYNNPVTFNCNDFINILFHGNMLFNMVENEDKEAMSVLGRMLNIENKEEVGEEETPTNTVS